VEVDVMLSRDGVPVVFHDGTLERTTDGEGLVRDHTLAQLRALRLRGPGGVGFAPGRIPTLEEVVQRVLDHNLKLEIELKTETVRTYALSRAVVALFAEYDLHERAFVSSFDPRFLYYVRDEDPSIVTALALMERPPYGAIGLPTAGRGVHHRLRWRGLLSGRRSRLGASHSAAREAADGQVENQALQRHLGQHELAAQARAGVLDDLGPAHQARKAAQARALHQHEDAGAAVLLNPARQRRGV
jgi:glycerophosphoryl diester phosphodiesterase